MLSTNRVGLKPTSTANGSAKNIRPMGHRNTCRQHCDVAGRHSRLGTSQQQQRQHLHAEPITCCAQHHHIRLNAPHLLTTMPAKQQSIPAVCTHKHTLYFSNHPHLHITRTSMLFLCPVQPQPHHARTSVRSRKGSAL
eukprot:GHRQ01040157.1.p2 GENE.GHRQ01040157.1~~GHRQ01040157.1.p2  ORF type:complete len:138 (+),score=17.85 GHRQ01040157.1:75-488(+)